MKKIFSLFLILAILSAFFTFSVSADTVYKAEGFTDFNKLFDANRATYTKSVTTATVTMTNEDLIGHVYIEFDRLPNGWKITADGVTKECGKERFLHDYIDVKSLFGSAKKSLTLEFPENTVIADIYGLPLGELPDFVQIWNSPLGEADLLLISSHSDDEQLFFAGMLPYYAIERKLSVQVAYSVQHFAVGASQNHVRPHEQLDGLWKVGIRNYPLMSDFPDVYSESKDRQTAFNQAEKAFGNAGVSYDDFKSYITEVIRRCKPLVVASHDLNGEYGHGTHVFTASALCEAIELAADKTNYPESAEKYGTWRVEKTYLHLYNQNQITMDWDTPLESLGGKSPFQITQEGFDCHKSQHWTWFYGWIYGKGNKITKASQITSYSPCEFGLYDTKVGFDSVGGDFFENVKVYSQRRAEAEALKKAEEEARLEKEKKANEKKALTDNKKKNKTKIIWSIVLLAVAILLIIVVIARVSAVRRKIRRRNRRTR